MLTPESSKEQGSDMKQAFQRHLPERIGAIEDNWNSLVREGWNPVKLTRLFQRTQDLTGSAGKFGLIQVSESVFSLELYFKGLLVSNNRPTERQLDEVNGLISNLKAVAENVQRPLADSVLRPQDKRQKVYFLRYDDNLAPGLPGALEALECTVIRFHRVDDLMGELEREQPAALVVDAQLLPNLKPLTEKLVRLKAEQANAPVLAMISASSDLDTRLHAMRAGTDAFFVTPVEPAAVATRIKQLSSPESRQPFRIMIVDDDQGQADFAAAILRKADMETFTVTEPLRVLDAMDSFRPDLILMDLYMPDADGIELTSIIREQNEFVSIPIVFLSGEQDADKQLDALSVGGDDFIAKPIRPRHLITTIKHRVQRARAVQRQAAPSSHRDPVSGLFNRRHFYERLDSVLSSSEPHPSAMGVLYLELDHKGELQQQIGVGQYDALTAEIGTLIADRCEPQDVNARIGDGTFAVLAKRPLNKQVTQLAETLVQAAAQNRFQSAQLGVQPTLSVGVCFFDEAADPSGLMSRAAKACADVKAQGGGRVRTFQTATPADTPEAPAAPRDNLDRVREALRNNTFQVLFQPFIDLHDKRSESYEMTLRLRTEQGDQIAAADFMPEARQAGLSVEIDKWITERAMEVLDERRRIGSEVHLLIAQSPESLADAERIDWLRDQLRCRQLVGSGLILEFNLVDLAGDLKRARGMINTLKEMGIAVCLARFGHNDASYKVLNFLGAGFIKVLGKLLKADPKVVATLVTRARELGARVIVPRVDDPRQIGQHWLSGADFVQGNAIQRPQEKPDYDFSNQLGS